MELLGDTFDWITAAEQWTGRNGIPARTTEHLQLALLSTLLAAFIALPPALWLAHKRRGQFTASAIVNLGRAIPSFGIIILAALLFLRSGWSIRFWPLVVALVALALPPVFTNAYASIRSVDPATVESARGMGLTDVQVLTGVEIPVGAPILMAGLRIALVQVIATVPLGAVVGPGGGLGRYIIDGFALGPAGHPRVLAGAVLVALLTLLTERAFTLIEQRFLPPMVRAQRARDIPTESSVPV